ncbi:MbcA/ParS/Xre antitoxin family protein [Bradyrhizobium sp. SYSU BS000235]|uniref:MbcA/ParS/Xre antitoxin family protein n=1 Tax=Bradyrhizobium sp. SYSU BS000235 TaxID=3411332 RepID=UPI003C73E89A
MAAVSQRAPDFVPADRQGLALEGFFQIMARWNIGNSDARRILGNPAERTFFQWKSGKAARVPEDTLRRIGYVAGIWKALQIVYSDAGLADTWVTRPNKAFGGQTPLARMVAGDVTDLAAVRAYVDAARAPWS